MAEQRNSIPAAYNPHRRKKQDMNRRYNVTTRRVLPTIAAVEKPWVLHKLIVCICSLTYPACNAHAPYCHLWSAPLYNIFPHYVKKRKDFRKRKLLNTKCVFWFSLQLLPETFLILSRIERDMIKICISIHVKYLLFLSDFNESWIFSVDF